MGCTAMLMVEAGWTVMAAGTAAARLQMGWMAEMVCMVGCTMVGVIEVIEVMTRVWSGCARLARLTTATAPGGPCGWNAVGMATSGHTLVTSGHTHIVTGGHNW